MGLTFQRWKKRLSRDTLLISARNELRTRKSLLVLISPNGTDSRSASATKMHVIEWLARMGSLRLLHGCWNCLMQKVFGVPDLELAIHGSKSHSRSPRGSVRFEAPCERLTGVWVKEEPINGTSTTSNGWFRSSRQQFRNGDSRKARRLSYLLGLPVTVVNRPLQHQR